MSEKETPSKIDRELRIMDPEAGDIRLAWSADPDEPAREAVAREAFNKAKDRGNMIFYRMNCDGSEGVAIKDFDPQADRIIGMPMVVGG